MVRQNTITAKDHINKMIKSNKIAFNSFDDKRFLLCAKHSVPYGSIVIVRSLDDLDEAEMVNDCFFCTHSTALY